MLQNVSTVEYKFCVRNLSIFKANSRQAKAKVKTFQDILGMFVNMFSLSGGENQREILAFGRCDILVLNDQRIASDLVRLEPL